MLAPASGLVEHCDSLTRSTGSPRCLLFPFSSVSRRSTGLGAGPGAAANAASEAERLLFGGKLTYDQGFAVHSDAWVALGTGGMGRMLPRQVRLAVRLTREADRRAFVTVSLSETVTGVTRAVSLIAVNFLLVGGPRSRERFQEGAHGAADDRGCRRPFGDRRGLPVGFGRDRSHPGYELQARQFPIPSVPVQPAPADSAPPPTTGGRRPTGRHAGRDRCVQ
ncbi:hypothetical protein CP979_00615 [Streptomyces filamentosus]|nr:hypothetical protein CP979_00615 [Streptomyces filamentosus]